MSRGDRVMDTVHVVFITYAMYFYMVLNFANPLIVERPVWSVFILDTYPCRLLIRWHRSVWVRLLVFCQPYIVLTEDIRA